MRASTVYVGLTMIGIALLIFFLAIHPLVTRSKDTRAKRLREAMVADLGLTDLCLFTETPYTRHPSIADSHAPFQAHPLALEHFPSGALIPPPHHLKKAGHAVD